jgi:hypothetical protein
MFSEIYVEKSSEWQLRKINRVPNLSIPQDYP